MDLVKVLVQGLALEADAIGNDTPLALFKADEARAQAFQQAAVERFALPQAVVSRQWGTIVDARDLVLLVRSQRRMQQ
jgi:hypothetical protein